jgi:hypothetical protein
MAYSVDYVPPAVIQALQTDSQLAIFLRVDTDPALHLYFGANEIEVGIDSIDANGTVYQGGGRLNGIPSLEVLVNGTSDAVDFTLSGIDPATGAAMLDSLPAVRGKRVQLGITTLDQDHQPMTAIIPIWNGTASHLKDAMAPVQAGEAATISLSLAVVTGENTRSRPSRSLWSDAMQRSLYPTDDFCKRTGAMARGIQPIWPRY